MSALSIMANQNSSKMTIIANLRAQRNILRQIRAELFESLAALLEVYPFEVSEAEGMSANGEEGGESDPYVQIQVLYGQLELVGKDVMEIHAAISELLRDGMGKEGRRTRYR